MSRSKRKNYADKISKKSDERRQANRADRREIKQSLDNEGVDIDLEDVPYSKKFFDSTHKWQD